MLAKPPVILCASLLTLSGIAQAALTAASDDASNYSSWGNNDNGGTGFQPWVVEINADGVNDFAGTFLGDSTAGAGNINTSGKSFGMYAYPGFASMSADRSFSSSLDIGSVFSFQMALNLDNGLKAMKLYAGSQDEVFRLDVGLSTEISSFNATLNPGAGAGYDYGGNDAVLDFMFTINSATSLSYKISRTSSEGFQGTLFSGTVENLTDGISGFGFSITGTIDDTAQNHLYVNNFAVIPEPSAALLCGLGLLSCTLRRRRNAL